MSAYGALLSAILDQLDVEIVRLRKVLPAEEYRFKEGHTATSYDPDAPRVYHESVLEVMDETKPGAYPIGMRWWPQLDELCSLRRRVRQYRTELGE